MPCHCSKPDKGLALILYLFIGYTEFGYIEVSKIRTVYADIFSGGDIFCNDYILGSGQFVCLQQGDIYMKKLQGVNFAMDGLVGNVETESVYCSDVVYTNELGDITTGIVHASMSISSKSFLLNSVCSNNIGTAHLPFILAERLLMIALWLNTCQVVCLAVQLLRKWFCLKS